jgi:hypothetical protein
MANEILIKSRTRIEAQGGTAAFTAGEDPNSGSYTGDTPVELDNRISASTGEPKGADHLQLELNVTTHAGGDATAEIWDSISEDGTNYTKWRYSHTVGETILSAATPRCDAGVYVLRAQYTKLAVVARSVGFNAELLATPKLPELQ